MDTLQTSRDIPATPDQVFAAFRDPARLARWWGPAGFTNTFHVCEVERGGRWSFVMHGPDGKSFPNECVFAEVDAPRKVVVEHVSPPKYRLTVELTPTKAGTLVSWAQTFESAEMAARIARVAGPANDQNLDRLAAEVRRGAAAS